MGDAATLGKWLLALGLVLGVVGILLILGTRLSIPVGRLPGDIRFTQGKLTVYVPVVTCLLLSLLLTVVLNLLLRARGR